MKQVLSAADLESAELLRRETKELGGRLSIATGTLLALFAASASDEESIQRIEESLSTQGLSTEPPLSAARSAKSITLVLEESRLERPRDEPPVQPDPPSQPPATEVLANAVAAMSPAALAAGVLVPGVLAAAIGLASWWGYGMLFLLLTGAAWWVVRRWAFGLSRVFFFPSRSLSWSAIMLAALPMLLAIALLSVGVVAPVSAERSADARDRQARALVAQAERALDRGDADEAERLLADAQGKRRDVAGYRDAKERADRLSREQDLEEQRSRAYDDAQSLLDNREYAAAMAAFEQLGDFRDAERLRRTAARNGAEELTDLRAALGTSA